jgi:hypothetical protein
MLVEKIQVNDLYIDSIRDWYAESVVEIYASSAPPT